MLRNPTARRSAVAVAEEMTWCSGEAGKAFGHGGGCGPALVGDQVRGQIAGGLDREHQVEGDEVERVAVGGELVGRRAATRAHASDPIVELGELALRDLGTHHSSACPGEPTLGNAPHE